MLGNMGLELKESGNLNPHSVPEEGVTKRKWPTLDFIEPNGCLQFFGGMLFFLKFEGALFGQQILQYRGLGRRPQSSLAPQQTDAVGPEADGPRQGQTIQED